MAMKTVKMLNRLNTLRLHLSATAGMSTRSASLIHDDATEVLFENVNNKGVITLNKVSALNAINHNMTVRIRQQLKVWEEDQSISLVIIKGAGGKSFSAGGDVRELAETALRNYQTDTAYQFLRDEYNTQYTIGTYRKPYIALVDGYCMGGGCGYSVNGKYRVVTEKTIMSMPEAAIGFYPDNGGSHFLSHLPGAIGTYLGLTCAQVRGEDAYKIGLATHYTTSGSGLLSVLEKELLALTHPSEQDVENVLEKYHKRCCTHQPLSFHQNLPRINSIFSLSSVEEIVEELRADNSEWASEALRAMMNNSPTSLKITHRILREVKRSDLLNCLTVELRLGRSILQNPASDFFDGVRAVLIDKTGGAHWVPSSIEEVSNELVDSHFTPLAQLGLKEFTPASD